MLHKQPSTVLFLLITMFGTFTGVSATLKVQAPQFLTDYFVKKYPSGNVPYSIANYGDVPYGKTISGEVGLPTVLEDCVLQDLPEQQQDKPILLIERNDCSFTQKSLNVQKEGGNLALIMDSEQEEDPGSIVMVDDGRGSQVHIPTILIGYEDGQQIFKALRSSSVVLSVSFEWHIRQKSDLTIWLDIAEHQNFIFLRNLQPYYNKIKDHVNFEVAYPTQYCPTCLETDCFYNGTYCRSNYKFFTVENKGQLLIREQLRQYYIFQQSVKKWWLYVMRYDDICDDLAIVEECSERVMKDVGISPAKIKFLVEKSFGSEDNEVLNHFSQQKYNNSIVYYPSVVINNIVYRGNLEPFEIYEVVCESLSTKPEGCEGYVAPPDNALLKWIIAVIVLSLLFGIFLIVCFRRIARRQLSQKINNQVNELVNQYITMYEHDRYNQAEEMPERRVVQPQA